MLRRSVSENFGVGNQNQGMLEVQETNYLQVWTWAQLQLWTLKSYHREYSDSCNRRNSDGYKYGLSNNCNHRHVISYNFGYPESHHCGDLNSYKIIVENFNSYNCSDWNSYNLWRFEKL